MSSSASSRQIGGDHYKNLSVEPWTAMESWLTREEFIGFLKGNVIKYIARANTKDDEENNLAKAAHYSQKLEEFISAHPAPRKRKKHTPSIDLVD